MEITHPDLTALHSQPRYQKKFNPAPRADAAPTLTKRRDRQKTHTTSRAHARAEHEVKNSRSTDMNQHEREVKCRVNKQPSDRTPSLHAYLRAAVNDDSIDIQRAVITTWATAQNRTITTWHTDQMDAPIPWTDRKPRMILDDCDPGDTIVVADLARLARSSVGLYTFIAEAARRCIYIVAVHDQMIIDAISAPEQLITAMDLAATIERKLLKARTAHGLLKRAQEKRPREGLPRQYGEHKLDHQAEAIDRLMAAKIPQRAIARLIPCTVSSLNGWLKRRKAKPVPTPDPWLPGLAPPPANDSNAATEQRA